MTTGNEAADLFDKHAASYNSKYGDVSLYHEGLDVFCSHLSPCAHVLELACGPGNITRRLLATRPDLQLLATDLSPSMLGLAKENNPAAAFLKMDCHDISTIQRKFDGIVCGFGLPYLSPVEATQFISHAANKLTPGGLLYISTMEGPAQLSGYQVSSSGDRLFINYHEAAHLAQAITAASMHIIYQAQFPNPANTVSGVTDIVFVARKG